ncbi:MAG: hypothetical protein Q9180_008934 [Flavoplaca navasiana]
MDFSMNHASPPLDGTIDPRLLMLPVQAASPIISPTTSIDTSTTPTIDTSNMPTDTSTTSASYSWPPDPNDYTDEQILAIACQYARPEFLTFPRHPAPITGPPIHTPSTIRPPIPTPNTTLPTALPARRAPSRRARKQAVRQHRSNKSLNNNNTAIASSSTTPAPAPAPSPFRFQEPITPAKAYAKHKAHGMRTTAEYLQIQPAGRKDYRGRETVTTAEKLE